MITLRALVTWLAEKLADETREKRSKQRVILGCFIAGLAGTLVFAMLFFKGNLVAIAGLMIEEGAASCFLMVIAFVYFSMEEDGADQAKIDFTGFVEKALPEIENQQTELKKTSHGRAVEELLFDLLKKRLSSETKFPKKEGQ